MLPACVGVPIRSNGPLFSVQVPPQNVWNTLRGFKKASQLRSSDITHHTAVAAAAGAKVQHTMHDKKHENEFHIIVSPPGEIGVAGDRCS